MARYFQGKSRPGRAEWLGKKKIRPEELTQDPPEEEEEEEKESDFVHTLSPKQKAEYNSLDKEQKTLVKYVLGVPGVDVSKIDLSGNKQKESSTASAPPLPSRRDDAHSGSGRSFGSDAGVRTKTTTGNGGIEKKRYEDSFLKEKSVSADRGTVFTHRSGSFASGGSDGGTQMNRNQAVNYLQSLKNEERRKSANPALVGALAAGVRVSRVPSLPEKKKEETVWQRALNTFLGGLKNSAAGFTDAARTLYEAGQGGRTRDMQDLRDSAARGLEMAERQLAYFREHPEAGDAETAQYSVDHFKRQVDAYDKVLNENIQQRATRQTAKLADDLQLSAQKDIDKAKEGLGWLGRGMVDAGASLTQMAGDGLLGAALGPGGGTLPFLARSFGSGTMKARQGGGTLDQQLLNGGLFAGVELLTEKLSSAALPFKAVYGNGNPALERKLDDLVTQAVRKFSASPTGRRILGGSLSAGKAFVTEGLEEFVGDGLEWQLPRLYGGDVNSFSDQLASSLNSFFAGGLTGLFGAALDPGTYSYGKRIDYKEEFDLSNSSRIGPPIGEERGETLWQKTLRDYKQKAVDNSPLDGYIYPDSIGVGSSLGAARKTYDILDLVTGDRFDLIDGTHLQNVEVFAGKGVKEPYRNAQNYARTFGGDEANWQHVKGIGVVDYFGEPRRAELHWSQCEGYGKHDFFIKRWLE